VLAIGSLSEALLSLVRSVALARILEPHDFGIAMVIATVFGIVELLTEIGLDRAAVSGAIRSDAHVYRNVLHAVSLGRGLINGLVLAALGPFIAWMVHAPEMSLWFSSLGLISLLRGFSHFDIKQMRQRYIYWPEGVVILVFQITWTVVTIALAIQLHDARSMAIGLLAAQLAYTVATHVLANARWRLHWDRVIVREIVSIGTPLVPSAMINAFNTMFDRLLIGSVLGPTAVGFYSAASMIALMPRAIAARFLNNVGLSVFVNHATPGTKQTRAFAMWSAGTITVSLVCSIGIACLMRPMLHILFGATYVPSPVLSILFAADFIPKFLICLISVPALAFGQTQTVLRYMIASTIGMLLGIVSLLIWRTTGAFVGGMLVGDLLFLVWLVIGAVRTYPYPAPMIYYLTLGAIGCFGAFAAVVLGWPAANPIDVYALAIHVVTAAVLAAGFVMAVVLTHRAEFSQARIEVKKAPRAEPNKLPRDDAPL
jgi:O-antigen/teichoic acid export membrane protein